MSTTLAGPAQATLAATSTPAATASAAATVAAAAASWCSDALTSVVAAILALGLLIAHYLNAAALAALTPVYLAGPRLIGMQGGVPMPELCATLAPSTTSHFWLANPVECGEIVAAQVQVLAVVVYLAAAAFIAWRCTVVWERRSLIRTVVAALAETRAALSPRSYYVRDGAVRSLTGGAGAGDADTKLS